MSQFQSISEILGAFRRRFFLIVLIVAIGCVISVYVALQQVKQYEAIAVIQIEAPEVTESLAGAAASRTDAAQRVKLVEQRLMSRDNLVNIIQKYGLFTDVPGLSLNERVGLMRGAVRLEQILTTTQSWIPGGTPSGMLIYVTLADPEKARDVANDLMYSVIDYSRERSIEAAQGALDLFTAEENRVADEIDLLEAQIASFKQQNAAYLDAGLGVLREELGTLRESDLEIDQQIVALEGRTRAGTEQQRNLLEEQKQIISNRIAEIEQTISDAPAFARDLNLLERELTRKKDQYSVITRRKAEAEMGQILEETQKGTRFEVLETALTPEYPVSRSRKSIALMGGVASVLVAVGIAFVLELLNPAIRTPQQMERALGIQPVVAIPHVSVRRERLRRRAAGLAGLAALVLAIPAVYRVFGDRISDFRASRAASTDSR